MKRNPLRTWLPYAFAAIVAPLIAAWPQRAQAVTTDWQGTTGGTPGDGLRWTASLNWMGDLVPSALDDATFGAPGTGGSTVHLVGTQTINSLAFDENFSLGAPGTNLVINNATGNLTVNSGSFVALNAAYGGPAGLNLSGGGSLYLTNPLSPYTGNITVSGAGTTLVHRQEGPSVQYAGINAAAETGRFDQVTLGWNTAVKTITLTNGGTYKILAAGNNAEGNYKNIVIGAGGGTLNLAAGYLLQNLDDVGQLSSVAGNTFTKAGPGRLVISGAMADANPLAGAVVVNDGMLSMDRLAAGGGAGTRFAGIAATGAPVTVNNGGTLLLNNGTQGRWDLASTTLNDGSILAVQGQDHIIGIDAGGAALTVNGTATFLTRDLFTPQTQRFPRLRADLAGSGTLNLIGNTNAGGNPRLVIERGSGSTFSGTFRLNENISLEANPRFNATVDTGKVIADGDIEFAGWGSTLDVRDSTAGPAAFDYTTNDIRITTGQAGNLNTISPGRATLPAGADNMLNFGTLAIGDHTLQITGNNSYDTGFSGTATVTGDARFRLGSNDSWLVFSNASAITEDAAGRSVSFIKTGQSDATARDVLIGGAVSVSNFEVEHGTVQLRGGGTIGTGFGGAAGTITVNGGSNGTNGLPSSGLLILNNDAAYTKGAQTVIAAANNSDRIADTATLNMRANGTLRLIGQNNTTTTETVGRTNVFGHNTFDTVKTGDTSASGPVALTLGNFTVGSRATVNFTGTSLGLAGNNTSRIVLPGTATGTLGAQFHSGNEWAKYGSGVDSGFALGVTPFVAGDYTIDASATDAGWAAGQQLKLTSATGTVMSANQTVARVNAQLGAANQAINLNGKILTVSEGGILTSGNAVGFKDGATAAVPSGTAGITAGTTNAATNLYVHANATTEFHAPIVDNAAGGSVTFVKSGTGTVVLSHQDRAVGAATAGNPFTTATWTSTNTGGWVINDGILNVHRGQYLGASPTTVTLNGGGLEINTPVSNANADTIIPGWGHSIVINGHALVGADDNGEAIDANTGDRALVPMGSLTINNNATLATGAFSGIDIVYRGGTTLNGRATFNVVRNDTNSATILAGAVTGSGFDVTGYNAAGGTIALGGGVTDTVSNTFNSGITMYAGTLRLNKANGTVAIPDTADAEDLIINGGSVLWGPGAYGDLLTTNNINTTNNGLVGRAPTSPASIFTAGANQIADTATITLLTGTLGESDRITNERFGSLIMKNGTFNVGLGTLEIGSATFSGGALGFDRGGTLKLGSATYLPGSFDQSVFTGLPVPGAYTNLEIGAGGISLSGQFLTLGNGFSGNVAGAGGRLNLGGNLTFNGSDLIGGSYGRKGIFIQTGSSFRELGNSHVDLMGGARDFNIGSDSIFTITAPLINGSITKSGGGALVLEPYQRSSFSGVTVNGGMVVAKGDGALGSGLGTVTVNMGGTVKLETGWTYANPFNVTGRGSNIAGDANVFESGAVVADGGTSRLTGAFTIGGNATLAATNFLDPSVAPGAGGGAWREGTLRLEGQGGITGSGNLTLAGDGDGLIQNGLNTASGGLIKEGSGRWTIARPGSYTGTTTIAAGALRITDGAALGSTASGTTVLGGSLEVSGGITSAEPLVLNGAGQSSQSGAVVNLSGNNTLSGGITIGSGATLRSDAGLLTVASGGPLSGTGGGALTLSGPGNGRIADALNLGTVPGDALIKSGTGSWQLAGNGSYIGGTRIEGGTLAIASAGTVLNAASPLTMAGGNLLITGAAQTSNGLNLAAGGGTVNGGAGLTLGAINRSLGATAVFAGSVTTTTPNTNGILGAYAVSGSNWAVAGGAISGFSGYTSLTHQTGTLAPGNHGNYNLDSNGYANGVHTVAIGGETLRIAAGRQGLQLDANAVTLGMGGLMKDGASIFNLGGSGLISGASANDELITQVNGGGLFVSNPLIGAGTGGLTKAGAGDLRLFGTSVFTGGININGGTLSIVGPGGTTHPGALGSGTGPRNITLNGGTFATLGDFDPNGNTMQFVVGSGGGTIRADYGGGIIINDVNQLSGPGDVTFSGGGRYLLNGGGTSFAGFTGNTTVDGGVLTVGRSDTLGGRQEQTLTLNPGSAVINATGFGLGLNGLPNNMVVNGGVEFFAQGGNRVYGGDIQLNGTNTIYLAERDTPQQERQLYFNGRVSGTGVTLDVFGANNGNPFYLASGSNTLTGDINLNANAVMEVRQPGSLGIGAGDVSVNLNGANSRLFLRHWQNGDYLANVNVNATSEINADRLTGFAGGTSQLLSINDLTTTTNGILTIGGGNAYTTRVGGTASFKANTVVNAVNNVLFENGIAFSGGANTLDKRGGGSVILRGASDHTGATEVQGGFLILQGANGALTNTNAIKLRGGELRVDNSDAINPNRLNDAAAISLGGGTLRITGAETLGTVTASSGTTIVVNNPTSDTVPVPLTLTGFTRQTGSVVQFQQADFGNATGAGTFGQTRVSSRILIPGQANTTQTIPGFLGNNNLDFIQYDGTTLDNGVPLGVRDMRNPGSGAAFPTNYTDNAAQTAWTDAVILRRTNGTDTTIVTDTLTANRALDAVKIETGGTNRDVVIDLTTFNLRIEGGGILDVAATTHDTNINGTTGILTAGPATPGSGTAELFLGGTSTLTNINAIVGNNGSQAVALVKTGSGTVSLTRANTYTGGTFVTGGTLNATSPDAFGAASNPITLAGGTLQFNVANAATVGDLGVPDHAVDVLANSTIVLDNGALAGTDNDISLGALTINGPYTLSMRGVDSMDASFTGTHTFAGRPTLDMAQAASGSPASVFTVNGAITGSAFDIASSGGTAASAGVLQIGGGASDTAANTYTGTVAVQLGANSGGLVVQLNKAAGTAAITGDFEINGGTVRNLAADQIADTSTIFLNQGQYDANGQNETIAALVMTGGNFRTNSPGTGAGSAVTILGNASVSGIDDLTGSADGLTVNGNSTLGINGTLRMTGLARAVLGASGATLNLGNLEMTGTTITQNSGAGFNIVRLNGDVTTFASAHTANLGNSTDSDTYLELNGTRIFNVADGAAGIDLAVSSVIRNSTAPAAVGSFTKTGAGSLQLQGGATANAYTGTTTVAQGSLVLFKSPDVNAIAGNLVIGNGSGPATTVIRNNEQIANTSNVSLGATGVLDLQSFNASESVGNLSSAAGGVTTLGPNSALAVEITSDSVYAGSINGGGNAFAAVTKTGTAKWTLSGTSEYSGDTVVNGGTLEVNGFVNGSEINVNSGGVLSGTGTVSDVVINPGGALAPGTSPGLLTTRSLTTTGGTYLLDINGTSPAANGSLYDTVNSRGSVDLGLGVTTLSLNLTYTPSLGDSFWPILNDGVDPILGFFAGLPEGGVLVSGPHSFQITYLADGSVTGPSSLTGGNDVALTVVPETSSVGLLGLTALLTLRRRRRAA